jgi:hypothetical protein
MKASDTYEVDGVSYETEEDFIQTGILGFCGCGRPEENLLYILGGLEVINDKGPIDPLAWDAWWELHKERVRTHFGNEDAAYFFYYWADKNRLTEHGGSVPGWLDEKGSRLLALLRQWKAGKE